MKRLVSLFLLASMLLMALPAPAEEANLLDPNDPHTFDFFVDWTWMDFDTFEGGIVHGLRVFPPFKVHLVQHFGEFRNHGEYLFLHPFFARVSEVSARRNVAIQRLLQLKNHVQLVQVGFLRPV